MRTKPSVGSIAVALFGRTRRAVLAFLLNHPDESFHLRELGRRTKCGIGGLQREMKNLAACGLVDEHHVGRQVHYSFNRECIVADELRSFFRKTSGVADVLRAALEPLSSAVEVAFVFGSIAAGRERSTSDIDVFVVGSVTFGQVVGALLPCQDEVGREVNPVVMDVAEFRQRAMDDDVFLRDVLGGDKMFLIGGEDDVARLVQ